MKSGTLGQVLAIVLLAVAAPAVEAVSPSSTNYSLPASAVNSGAGDMASTTFKLSSALGDVAATSRQTSTGFVLSSGFWQAVIGVTQGCVLDLDGDQTLSATTDGLMLLRAMLGLTGTAVTNGATATGAPRTTWEQISPFVHLAALDIDGSGSAAPASDGVMLLRAMFGLTGTAVTHNAVAGGKTWLEVRAYLNSQCGTNFGP